MTPDEEYRAQLRDVSIPNAPNGSIREVLEGLLAEVEARISAIAA